MKTAALVTFLALSAGVATLYLPGAAEPLGGDFHWMAGPPLVAPLDRDGDHYHSVKDPSIVRYQGRWHMFCTVRGLKRSHQIEHLSFADWKATAKADRRMMKLVDGYFCAPQVFYFRPHKKWYLIYQVIEKTRKPELQPAWSSTDTITDTYSWTPPRLLFDAHPTNVKMWIDFWVICDNERAHLFFTSLDGKLWRAETRLADFPGGWGEPRIVLEDDIYEASHTYALRGISRYLTLVEAVGPEGRRYYKAYVANRLDGTWSRLAASYDRPFASPHNVRFSGDGWSDSFSHGELIRDGYDETLTVNPKRWAFLYQGVRDADRKGKVYGEIPWHLGLLKPAP
jgi:hypothetical protein